MDVWINAWMRGAWTKGCIDAWMEKHLNFVWAEDIREARHDTARLELVMEVRRGRDDVRGPEEDVKTAAFGPGPGSFPASIAISTTSSAATSCARGGERDRRAQLEKGAERKVPNVTHTQPGHHCYTGFWPWQLSNSWHQDLRLERCVF